MAVARGEYWAARLDTMRVYLTGDTTVDRSAVHGAACWVAPKGNRSVSKKGFGTDIQSVGSTASWMDGR